MTSTDEEDVSAGRYGLSSLIRSSERLDDIVFSDIAAIGTPSEGQEVWVRGRLHASRIIGKAVFIDIRQRDFTIQGCVFMGPETSKQMVDFVGKVSKESIVDVRAIVRKAAAKGRSCTHNDVELSIRELFVVSAAEPRLPIPIDDADSAATQGTLQIAVPLDARLDDRVLDLRRRACYSIFKIKSGACDTFRYALKKRGFMEIHIPKMILAPTEGAYNAFKIKYFTESAYLAQSSRMHVQMAIAGDFEKVFTIGAVFRADHPRTYRSLTEFVGLELGMAFNFHYHEVMHIIAEVMLEVFHNLEETHPKEIDTVRRQYACEPLVLAEKPLVLTYPSAMALLRANGTEQGDEEDLSFMHARLLGKLVREKYNTDFFILDKVPLSVRPFYTMPDAHDGRFSNSFDVFMRGEKVLSGGQYIHDARILIQRAQDNEKDLDKMKAYIDAFRYGCPPHAGARMGLERFIMLYLGLDNIRLCSLFPRDSTRLTP